MKTILPYPAILFRLCIWKRIRVFLLIFLNLFSAVLTFSQCPAGYTSATVNWDYLDYFHSNATYTSWVSASARQTQYFAIGTNRLTINTTIPVGSFGTLYGDVTEHTGESGSYGSGADVKYIGDGTINMTFQSAVQNVTFSFYDIDYEQRITVTANDAGTPRNITMTKVSGTILTVTGSGTTSANAKAATSPAAVTSSDGTVNVSITGPITNITITISETNTKTTGPASGQEDGSYFLSDITACVADPGFPNNYYSSYTQPFTGQPSYFLANPQSLHVYMVNASTAEADYIFSDPGTNGNKMNALAYDPVNKWIYYVMDNAPAPGGPSNNKSLKKYDVNTKSISTVLADITSLGIPTFSQGIEYGGASFYNGSLYLGIEGSDGISYYTNGESIIWRIDFDGSGNPLRASQVFGVPGDNGGGTPTDDWGDFVIKDGIIISHTANGFSSNHYIHFNMQTSQAYTYSGTAESAGQLGQTWNGNIYRIKNNIALYNNNGTIGSLTSIATTSCSPAWSGNAGDASDPFKPKCDFGDAPASYDPVALSPAANQKACNNANLRIGSLWGDEWSKYTSTDASGDGDEDGISTVTMMVADGVPYNHVQEVTVLNNTGANATLGGWLDYNANGIFEASEAVIVSVSSSASPQVINLAWNNITVASGTPNSFLRIRLVSGSTPLTTSNATGWYNDGETEDYQVISSEFALAIELLQFNAIVTKEKNVLLSWKAIVDEQASGFELQRSKGGTNWEKIAWIEKASTNLSDYTYTDNNPFEGLSYYRLKMVDKDGSSRYSYVRNVILDQLIRKIRVLPNPVTSGSVVNFNSASFESAVVSIRTFNGQLLKSEKVNLSKGENNIPLNMPPSSKGFYIVELKTETDNYITRILVNN